ncbi:MAG: hypothetical protein J7527_12745, partial [Chitinophagaceae bacterium]|nr:hypothetical protein [Chitinophagaceae bacterium]
MPDIIQLLADWKKQISIVVLISVIVAAGIVFIIPPKYLAIATALPANPITADKSLIFNDNIRDVYSSIGTPTELDRVVGTAQSDTIYLSVAQKFDLVSFYKIDKDKDFALMKAAKQLKEDSKVSKTEFGELMIRVWCSNKLLAPQLANAMMDELALMHQEILNRNNQLVLKNIRDAIHLIYSGADSLMDDET